MRPRVGAARAAGESSGKLYPVVCCSRMDVLYIDKLPAACVEELQALSDPSTVFVPDFHEWKMSSTGSGKSLRCLCAQQPRVKVHSRMQRSVLLFISVFGRPFLLFTGRSDTVGLSMAEVLSILASRRPIVYRKAQETPTQNG